MSASATGPFDPCGVHRPQDLLQLPNTARDGRPTTARRPSRSTRTDNTFVHKLYGLVNDPRYGHLIEWECTGLSFLVRNVMEFSRDVLPKHFKHSNFSSFIRQLNMYGFCKVNKSPRGHRSLADESQVWEFSHSNFVRGRPDLVDSIKRKALDHHESKSSTGGTGADKRSTSTAASPMDPHSSNSSPAHSARMAMLQVNHSNISRQIVQLQANCNQVMQELGETQKRQDLHQKLMQDMMDLLMPRGANAVGPAPPEATPYHYHPSSMAHQPPCHPPPPPPPIYVTTPPGSAYPPPSLHPDQVAAVCAPMAMCVDPPPQQQIPATPPSKYHAVSTPSSPGPTTPFTDDEATSVCSFQSPHTPTSAMAAFTPDRFM